MKASTAAKLDYDDFEEEVETPVDWLTIREEQIWHESYSLFGRSPSRFETKEPYKLEESFWLPPRYRNPLKISYPEQARRDGLEECLCERNYLLDIEDGEGILNRYEKNLGEDENLCPASIRKLGKDEIEIKLGIRRGRRPRKMDIAKGVFYFSIPAAREEGAYQWHGTNYMPSFYPSLIHPYVRNQNENDPFEWACNRAKIAMGFGVSMGCGKDFPPDYAEYPFRKMASRVCNTTPTHMLKPREFELGQDEKNLLLALQESYEGEIVPEITCFLLENKGCLTVEAVRALGKSGVLKNFGKCLENGLIIDKVGRFFVKLIGGKLNLGYALTQTFRIFGLIYGGEKEPWWFKEDVDLGELFDDRFEEVKIANGTLQTGACVDSVTIFSEMARQAGFAFTYAIDVYKRSAFKMAEVEGFSQGQAIQFCAKITQAYGIGNVKRACNVVNFALEAVKKVEVAERPKVLANFEVFALERKPWTEIVGRLEGEEASIDLPGIFSMARKEIGDDRAREEELDEVTLSPQHIQELTRHLALPLVERAKSEPLLAVPLKGHLLLAANIEDRLALPVAQEHKDLRAPNPLPEIFAFYKQMREECGYVDGDIADAYFAFFADKMPNPFVPPKGFLNFLQQFESVPVAGNRFVYLSRPDARSQLTQANSERMVYKYLVVSNLLDTWVMGMISEAELFEVFNWLVAKTPAKKKEEIEQKHRAWQKIYDAELGGCEEDESERAVARNVDMEVKNYQTKLRQRNLKHLSMAVASLVDINFYVALGVLERKEASLFFKGRLKDLTRAVEDEDPDMREEFGEREDDEFGGTDRNTLSEPWNGEIMLNVQEMIKEGLLDVAAFRKVFRDSPDKIRLLADFADLVRNFAYVKAQIQRAETEIISPDPKSGKPGDFDPEKMAEILGRLERDLAEKWTNLPPFINCGEIQILLRKYLRADHLMYLHAALADFRKDLGPTEKYSGPNPEENQNVRSVSVVSMSIVAAAMGMREYQGRENLDLVGTLPAEAGNMALDKPVNPMDLALKTVRDLSDRLRAVCPQIRDQLVEVRRDTMGLLPIGGKIHVLHEVDMKKFAAFTSLAGLGSTAFRLLHANTSVNLPAVPSWKELKLIASSLEAFGIIDRELPELQVGVPGRLRAEDAAILGSAVLLATEKGKDYDEKSFCTNQDHSTGRKIMSYDAMGPRVKLPFMTSLNGRTDMLGRRSLEDIELYQLLGTVLIQGQAQSGPFQHLAGRFKEEYLEILKAHGIDSVLRGSWIFDPVVDRLQDDEVNRDHFQTVKMCTDAYFACAEDYAETREEKGIIFEVRALFDWLRAEIRQIQELMYFSGKPCEEMRILLEF